MVKKNEAKDPFETDGEAVVSEDSEPQVEPTDIFGDVGGGSEQLYGTDQRSGRQPVERIRPGDEGHPDLLGNPLDLDVQTPPAPKVKAAVPDPVSTPNVPAEVVKSLQRSEEIEAELVRSEGRYIESIDNAKPGRTITGALNSSEEASPLTFAQQEYTFRAEGANVNPDAGNYFDTGSGAQTVEDLSEVGDDPHDPRSDAFMTCLNNNCNYRSGCLRYRMKASRTKNAAVFFPEQCRADGTYIALTDSDFTGYGSFESIDGMTAPSSLGVPE